MSQNWIMKPQGSGVNIKKWFSVASTQKTCYSCYPNLTKKNRINPKKTSCNVKNNLPGFTFLLSGGTTHDGYEKNTRFRSRPLEELYITSRNGRTYKWVNGVIIFSPTWLVVSTNPIEKYARQIGFIFPKLRGENRKTSESTT